MVQNQWAKTVSTVYTLFFIVTKVLRTPGLFFGTKKTAANQASTLLLLKALASGHVDE